MGIPQLDSCCCGCTLRTGTKIIGWISLVVSIVMLIVVVTGLAALYYIQDHPDSDTPDSQEIRKHLPALKALSIFLILVHLVGCALALVLLLGAYQSKAKLVLIWVVVALTSCLIEQAVNIAQMFTLFQATNLTSFIVFLIDLYFILVVYSFYREINNNVPSYS